MKTLLTHIISFLACLLLSNNMLAQTFTVTNTNDSGPGSLRQAILDANDRAGKDTILFNIDISLSSDSGYYVIQPDTNLPVISDSLFIDGQSQPGVIDTPLVVLDGQRFESWALIFANDTAYLDNCGFQYLDIRNFTAEEYNGVNEDCEQISLILHEGNFLCRHNRFVNNTGRISLGRGENITYEYNSALHNDSLFYTKPQTAKSLFRFERTNDISFVKNIIISKYDLIDGVFISTVDNDNQAIIKSNFITGFNNGLFFISNDKVGGAGITKNTLKSCKNGATIIGNESTKIYDNTIFQCSNGAKISSNNSKFFKNKIFECDVGMALGMTVYTNSCARGNVSTPSSVGVQIGGLADSSNFIFKNQTGISLQSVSFNIKIFNNFIGLDTLLNEAGNNLNGITGNFGEPFIGGNEAAYGNIIAYNGKAGIKGSFSAGFSNKMEIGNNYIYLNGDGAIHIDRGNGSDTTLIYSNKIGITENGDTVGNGGTGILLKNNHSSISNNVIHTVSGNGIIFEGNSGTISNNFLSNIDSSAIILNQSFTNQINDNQIYNTGLNGITMNNSSGNTIDNLDVEDAKIGVLVEPNSYSNSFLNSSFSFVDYGISIANRSAANKITQCEFKAINIEPINLFLNDPFPGNSGKPKPNLDSITISKDGIILTGSTEPGDTIEIYGIKENSPEVYVFLTKVYSENDIFSTVLDPENFISDTILYLSSIAFNNSNNTSQFSQRLKIPGNLCFFNQAEVFPDTSKYLCPGDTLRSPFENDGFKHYWFRNSELIDSSNYLENPNTGEYALTVEDQYGCSISDTIKAVVNGENIQPNFLVSSQASTKDKLALIDVTLSEVDSTKWLFNGDFSQDIEYTYVSFEDTGTYEITLLKYADGCSFQVKKSIAITEDYINFDGSRQARSSDFKTVSAFPNPFADRLTVDVSLYEEKPLTLSLLSLNSGVVLLEKTFDINSSFEAVLHLTQFSSGTYLLKLSTQDSNYLVKLKK